jgi:hypothetical protein
MMMSESPLGGYVEVRDRIRAFRDKHPDGSLQPVNPEEPYALEYIQVGDEHRCFIVYKAAAYRTADDARPGIGTAWEPFPGLTPFTRNSELMNAETSAWGRAIVAAMAADADAPIATGDDVVKRRAEDGQTHQASSPRGITEKQMAAIHAIAKKLEITEEVLKAGAKRDYGVEHLHELTSKQASELIDKLKAVRT